MPTRTPTAWASLAGRLVLGAVLVVAGAGKLPDPSGSVRAVRAYDLLPESLVTTVGLGLPVLEVALGIMLVLGIAVRLSAAVSAVLLAMFMLGIASAWARGLAIDCGCFGGGGEVASDATRYGREILRDTALLLVAAALVRWPASRFALTARTPAAPDDEGT